MSFIKENINAETFSEAEVKGAELLFIEANTTDNAPYLEKIEDAKLSRWAWGNYRLVGSPQTLQTWIQEGTPWGDRIDLVSIGAKQSPGFIKES